MRMPYYRNENIQINESSYAKLQCYVQILEILIVLYEMSACEIRERGIIYLMNQFFPQ